jgi:hypothetical protein
MASPTDTDTATVTTDSIDVFKAAEEFLDANPELRSAMEIFEVAQTEYRASLQALQPVKVFASHSTTACE